MLRTHGRNILKVCNFIAQRKQFKGTLTQIWKSANIFLFIWKQYVQDLTLKHLLLFVTCAREIYEVYKHSETIEYVENEPTF